MDIFEEEGQLYLYGKLADKSRTYGDVGKIYGADVIVKREHPNRKTIEAFNVLFKGLSLTKEFEMEICLYYTLCSEALEFKSSMISMDYNNQDWFYEQNKMQILANEFTLLRNKIKDKLSKSKILGKVYNYLTNKIEYELEDGRFVVIDGDKLIPPAIELDRSVFPDIFLYMIGEIADMRENRINEILK